MLTVFPRVLLPILAISLSSVLSQDTKPADPFVKSKSGPKPAAAASVNAPGAPPVVSLNVSLLPEPRPTNMLFTFETYTLSQESLDAIHESAPKNPAFYENVRKLVTEGKAVLESVMSLPTRSGQRATTESIDEVLYATQFEGPVPGRNFGFPSAYEMRPTGERVELDPVMGEDGHTVFINMAPEFTRLAGMVLQKADDKTDGELQPLFVSRKVTTSTSCQLDVPWYVGTFSKAQQTGLTEVDGAAPAAVMFVTARLSGPTEALPPSEQPHLDPSKDMDPRNIRTVYRFYSLPRAAAHDLLSTTVDPDKLHSQLRALPSTDWKLERLLTLQTRTGQRATLEESAENIYGTEVESSKSPGVKRGKEKAAVTESDAAQKGQATSPEEPSLTRGQPLLPAKFKSFEMRPLGWRIEVDPVLSPDGRVTDLNLATEHTEHRGNLQGHAMLSRYPQMPVFAAQKTTTAVTTLVGHQCFLGTMNPPRETGVNGRKDDGRTWFAFVKVTLE